jgi:hypothetical protein
VNLASQESLFSYRKTLYEGEDDAQENLDSSFVARYIDNLDGWVDFLLRRKIKANSNKNV